MPCYDRASMDAVHKPLLTEEEYIARERAVPTKSEFLRGEIFAMAGAKPRHNLVAANVIGALRSLLRDRPCLVLTSDQRVYVAASGLFTYLDVVVVCDGPRFHPKHDDTLVNPTVIVEVLSSSTEAYDRGAKFALYRAIESLREYVLVTPDATSVEHYARQTDGSWRLTTWGTAGESVPLDALGVAMPLAEVYAKVDSLPPDAATTPLPPRSKVLDR